MGRAALAIMGKDTRSTGLSGMPRAYTWVQLRSEFGEGRARTLVRRVAVRTVLPGVYAEAEHAESFVVRAEAALLWAGHQAALSGPSALFAWGGLELPPETVEIRVPRDFHPHPPRWVRVRRPMRSVATVKLGRLDAVNPATAVVTAYASLPQGVRAGAVFGAVKCGLVSAEDLKDEVAASPRVARRGELLGHIGAALRGLESLLEEISARDVFSGPGFEGLILQHTVAWQGMRARFDFYDPETRTAFEVDGSAWHSGVDERARDIRRDAHFAAAGIVTVRFSWADVVGDPARCRAVALETMRRRASRAA